MKIGKEAIHKIEVEALASQIAELKGEVDYLKEQNEALLLVIKRKDSLIGTCANVLASTINSLIPCEKVLDGDSGEVKAFKWAVGEVLKPARENLEKLNDAMPLAY